MLKLGMIPAARLLSELVAESTRMSQPALPVPALVVAFAVLQLVLDAEFLALDSLPLQHPAALDLVCCRRSFSRCRPASLQSSRSVG